MFRKNHLNIFLTIALILIGGIAAFGQTAPISGQVVLKGADGKMTPVQGALVEVFRTDIKGKFPPSTTDKKGYFNFAGLPLGALFALSVSGPGISPDIIQNVKAGMDKLTIDVLAGDGKRRTEDEVRQSLANPTSNQQSGELTAEQKRAKAEFDKQVADITNKNEKIKKATDIVNASLKEGGAAFDAKNYDLAIAKFTEGYNADPNFAGTAPVLLNNKSLALLNRGTDSYNKSVKAADPDKTTLRNSAKSDFAEVVIASDRALELLKTETSTDAAVQKNYDANKFSALANRKNAYRLMSQTGVDREKGKEAAIAFQEYLAVETDPAKKMKAQVDLAAALQDSGEYELAVTEYKKVLETDPNNVDALAGAGLNLVTVGYITMEGDSTKGIAANPTTGKAQLQEAANFLQKFIDLAPADNKLLASVKESINDLKAAQNLTPQKVKTTTTTKKKN